MSDRILRDEYPLVVNGDFEPVPEAAVLYTEAGYEIPAAAEYDRPTADFYNDAPAMSTDYTVPASFYAGDVPVMPSEPALPAAAADYNRPAIGFAQDAQVMLTEYTMPATTMSAIPRMESGRHIVNMGMGELPPEAPLAAAYVPMQRSVNPVYDAKEALVSGTLFPGLDLPFMNIMNTGMPETPMDELLALGFVAHELGLYLDTHMDDREALEMYKKMVALEAEGRRRYVERYGPITKADMAMENGNTWATSPWPWEVERQGK